MIFFNRESGLKGGDLLGSCGLCEKWEGFKLKG